MNEMIGIKVATTTFIAGTLAMLGIPEFEFYLLSALMVIDLITGMMKTKVIDGGDSITSFRLIKGVLFKMMTLLLLLSIAIGVKALGISTVVAVTTCMSVMVAGELYSIIQNYYSAQTGKRLSEYKALTLLLERISDFLRNSTNQQK